MQWPDPTAQQLQPERHHPDQPGLAESNRLEGHADPEQAVQHYSHTNLRFILHLVESD